MLVNAGMAERGRRVPRVGELLRDAAADDGGASDREGPREAGRWGMAKIRSSGLTSPGVSGAALGRAAPTS